MLHVEFNKMPCRHVEFKGQGPHFKVHKVQVKTAGETREGGIGTKGVVGKGRGEESRGRQRAPTKYQTLDQRPLILDISRPVARQTLTADSAA